MSVTKPSIVKQIPAERMTVHNATGGKLEQGRLVRLTGGSTGGVPNVEYTAGIVADADDTISGSSDWIGALYEDIEDGKDGVCLVAENMILDLIAGASISLGDRLIATANGQVIPMPTPPDVTAPTTGAWKLRLYILVGKALESKSAGERVKVKLRKEIISLFRQA